MYKCFHIWLIPHKSLFSSILEGFYTLTLEENFIFHLQKSAPPDLFSCAKTIEYRKNIRLIRTERRIRKLLIVLQSNPKIANMVLYFTVETFRAEGTIEFSLQNELVYDSKFFYQPLIDVLSDPMLYFSVLKNCTHLSLPIQLIPRTKINFQLSGNLESFTLNSGPINDIDFKMRREFFLLLRTWQLPKKYEQKIYPEKTAKKNIRIHQQDLKYDLLTLHYLWGDINLTYRSQVESVIGGTERLVTFLDICATNPNIRRVYFHGFESFNKYTMFLLHAASRSPSPYPESISSLETKQSELLDSLTKFAARLAIDTSQSNSIPFEKITAVNTENKFLDNAGNFSWLDFSNFLSEYLPDKSSVFKIRNMAVHSIHEELTPVCELKRNLDEKGETEVVGYKLDNHQNFLHELNELKIYQEYLDTLEYSVRLSGSNRACERTVIHSPFTKDSTRESVILEKPASRAMGMTWKEEEIFVTGLLRPWT